MPRLEPERPDDLLEGLSQSIADERGAKTNPGVLIQLTIEAGRRCCPSGARWYEGHCPYSRRERAEKYEVMKTGIGPEMQARSGHPGQVTPKERQIRVGAQPQCYLAPSPQPLSLPRSPGPGPWSSEA